MKIYTMNFLLIKLKKEREAKLKEISGEYIEIVDEETGEIEKLIAPIKELINQLVIKL